MKYINIADIHFGNAGNSTFHNENLLKFFEWMWEWVEENDMHKAELNILGDVFHARDKLSVDTINYALQGIEFLSSVFPKVNIIVGNHDMFHRDRIDINSVNMFKYLGNVSIIDHIVTKDDVVFSPWVIGVEDFDTLIKHTKKHKTKTLFSHLEFSTFRLNDNYIMEHGLTHKSLKHVGKIFTGHYHGRQEMDNVIYVGNPFPFDYNDANDLAKGFCVVDTDTEEHYFIDYEQISVDSVTYEEFLELDIENMDDDFSKNSLRIVIKDDISDEDMDNLKSILENKNFHDTKVVYKRTAAKNAVEGETDIDVGDKLMTVDEAVLNHIDNIDESNTTVNKSLLRTLYTESIDE